MAAPVLRHYAVTTMTDGTWVSTPAVPGGRALVISKIVVANATGGVTAFMDMTSGSNTDPGVALAWGVRIGPGQVYTETGVVLGQGEFISVRHRGSSEAGTFRVQVFGEEVDN